MQVYRQSQLIRVIPNGLTLLNALFGFLSILLIGQDMLLGLSAIILAILCDIFDGVIARKLDICTDFGTYIDSLSDVVSFGISPSLLIATVHGGYLGVVFGAVYLVCAVWRLACFSAQPTAGMFRGLPSPVAALIVWVCGISNPMFLGPVALVTGSAMICSSISFKKPWG